MLILDNFTEMPLLDQEELSLDLTDLGPNSDPSNFKFGQFMSK